jgi:hypothetical protein
MTKQLRLIGPNVVVLLVALAVVLPRTEWERDPNSPEDLSAGPGEEQEAQAILKGLQRRSAAKELIVRSLIEGRITLFEAAALFRDLNREYPELRFLDAPGDSEEEKLCRQVIRWVEAVLGAPERAGRDASARFEEELRWHKQQNGKVILQTPGRGD